MCLPFARQAVAAELYKKKFDFGNAGTEAGYTGVTSKDVYSKSRGYGFANEKTGTDVVLSGTSGVLKDACSFDNDTDHRFYVDLPNGMYKITVTTGDDVGSTITANGYPQLFFLKGKNATDSFTLPITDGQLAIYPTNGNPGTHSLCSLEIEQLCSVEEAKPTIWIYGDSTVCNYYNVPDTNAYGWGQFLGDYIDTNQYYVRNMAIDGMSATVLDSHASFKTAETFGKKGDILILSIGINDFRDKEISAKNYSDAMLDMVKRGKAKGMTIYLVKQQGYRDDFKEYPELSKQWYSDEIDAIAKSESVKVIDLFSLWSMFCLQKTDKIVRNYYSIDKNGDISEVHPNKSGAKAIAEIMANQLFPDPNNNSGNSGTGTGGTGSGTGTGGSGSSGSGSGTGGYEDDPPVTFDANLTVNYQAEVAGVPVTNPHKGFVMNVEKPYQFESDYPKGIGNNPAWDVVSICSATYFWKDLNPQEDVYNWDEIDSMLEACAAHGKTLGIRVVPYHTGSGNDANYGEAYNFVPQWVYDKGATMDDATYKYKNTSAHIHIPTWSNSVYIEAHKKFVAALAERYDGDPRLEYVEIRAFGNFGEWHTSQFNGNPMPSEEQQMDMIGYYKSVFKNTTVCAMSDVRGEVYDYAISIGVAKRNNGLIMGKNEEYDLVPAYEANLMTMGDNHNLYKTMKEMDPNNPEKYIPWTVERFRHVVDTAHLSIYSLDLDSTFGVDIYNEQKPLIDEYVNRLGYNFTVTSAARYDNKLVVRVKNTGLAPCFFDINLCAEVTDAEGNKLSDLGEPVLIPNGSFHDGVTKTFIFEKEGDLPSDAQICLSMYEANNPSTVGKNPTVRFDNKNLLPNNKLLLVETSREISDKPGTTPGNGGTGNGGSGNGGSNNGNSNNGNGTGSGTSGNGNSGTSGNGSAGSTPTATPIAAPKLDVGDFISRCYEVALGREADEAGYNYWVESLINGQACGAQVGFGFIFSEEYLNKNRTNEEFVKDMYAMYFGREADEGGFNYWVEQLNNSTATREDIMAGFANSEEFFNLCGKYGVVCGAYLVGVPNEQQGGVNCFVARLYKVCLNRLPDMGGQAGWVIKLMNGEVTGSSCSYGFVFSPEFMNLGLNNTDYVKYMYRAFFGREADEEGLNYWVSQLDGGTATRENVFAGFTGSAEFINLCASYGINA